MLSIYQSSGIMGRMNAVSPLIENVAPPGLKGLVVADTEVGSVRGEEGVVPLPGLERCRAGPRPLF